MQLTSNLVPILIGGLAILSLITTTSSQTLKQEETQQSSTCPFESLSSKNRSSKQNAPFKCSNEPVANLWQQEEKEGRERQAGNWNYQYVDEQTPGFDLKIKEDSADERLANVVRTINTARLYYYFAYKFDSPIAGVTNEELEQLAAGPRVDDALCSEHLREMLEQMREMREIMDLRKQQQHNNNSSAKFEEKHLRLAKVLDSFGGYEAGLLSGRTHMIGSYSQCTGSQLLLNNNQQLVPSRYCMANLDVTEHQDAGLKMDKFESDEFEPADDVLSVAICLPESCHTRNFNQNKELLQTLVGSQFKLPTSIYQDEHLPLKSVFCEVDKESSLLQIPASGRLLLLFLGLWISALLYATFHHNVIAVQDKSQPSVLAPFVSDKVLKCLDLRSSWHEFIGDANVRNLDDPQNRVSLDTLSPVKVVGCLIVVWGHSLMVQCGFTMDMLRSLKEMESDPKVFFMVGLTIIVDSFFVITGILLAFVAMKRLYNSEKVDKLVESTELKRSQSGIMGKGSKFLKQCSSFILVRYLRLVPMYFLVFWFKKSIMTTLSNGPFWDYGYNRETEAGACREESWLTPLNFQAAYLPLSRQCMPQAWSIASDLFFSVISAPIIVLMVNHPAAAVLLAIATCVMSNISLIVSNVSQIDADTMTDLMNLKLVSVSRLFRTYSYLYTAPHFRIFSVLVGLLAGYQLYHYSKAHDSSHRLHRWPAWFRGVATKLSLWYIVCTLTTTPLIPPLKEYIIQYPTFQQALVLHLSSTNRLFWAISNAIVFLRMVTDWKDTYWMRNSASKFWTSMAKLNFAILLVHVDLLKFDDYMQLNTIYYSFYAICRTFAAVHLFSTALAVLLHVMFENPVDKLVKYATANKVKAN